MNDNLQKKYTDEEIEDMIRVSDQEHKAWLHSRSGIQTILGGCIAVFGCIFGLWLSMMKFPESPFAMIAGLCIPFALGAVLLVTAKPLSDKVLTVAELKLLISNTIIPQTLEKEFDSVTEYDPAGYFSPEVVRETCYIPMDYNSVRGGDMVRGIYKGRKVELCDMNLRERWENSEGKSQYNDVFKGIWIIVDLGKKLAEDMIIFEKVSGNDYRNKLNVDMDNEAFNRQFQVRCADSYEAFYILTPQVIERITRLDEMGNGRTFLKFLKDGRLGIAVNTGKDMLFDLHGIHEPMAELRRRFASELRYPLDLIDEILRSEEG